MLQASRTEAFEDLSFAELRDLSLVDAARASVHRSSEIWWSEVWAWCMPDQRALVLQQQYDCPSISGFAALPV